MVTSEEQYNTVNLNCPEPYNQIILGLSGRCKYLNGECLKCESELATAKAHYLKTDMPPDGSKWKPVDPTPPPAEGDGKSFRLHCPACGEKVSFRVPGCYYWCQSCAVKWSKDAGAAENDSLTARVKELEKRNGQLQAFNEEKDTQLADLRTQLAELTKEADSTIDLMLEKGDLADHRGASDCPNSVAALGGVAMQLHLKLAAKTSELTERSAEAVELQRGHTELEEQLETQIANNDTQSEQLLTIAERAGAAEHERDEAKAEFKAFRAPLLETFETLSAGKICEKYNDAQADAARLDWPILIHLYNTGYHSGHHDTVESQYTHIEAAELDSYHEDEVREIVPALRDAAAAAMGGGGEEGKCRYCGSKRGKADSLEVMTGPDSGLYCSTKCRNDAVAEREADEAAPPAERSVEERIEAVLFHASLHRSGGQYRFGNDGKWHETLIAALHDAEGGGDAR